MTEPRAGEASLIDPARARRRHAIFLAVSAAIALVGHHRCARGAAAVRPRARHRVRAHAARRVGRAEARPARARDHPRLRRRARLARVCFVRLSAPRVAQELASFRRELPVSRARDQDAVGPAVQQRLRALGARRPGAAPPAERPSRDTRRTTGRTTRRRSSRERAPDGSFAIELQGRLAVNPTEGRRLHDRAACASRGTEQFDLDQARRGARRQEHRVRAAQRARGREDRPRHHRRREPRSSSSSVITLMLAAYIDAHARADPRVLRVARPPERAPLVARAPRAGSTAGSPGVVRGQLIICLVNGVLSAIGFAIVGLKYWPVLALVATVLQPHPDLRLDPQLDPRGRPRPHAVVRHGGRSCSRGSSASTSSRRTS